MHISVRRARVGVLSVAAVFFGLIVAGCKPAGLAGQPPPAADGYLFCFWNVENFFDDRKDDRKGPGDKEYDTWFADNPQILKLKLSKLTDALLKLNGGKGPDILALAEVESLRSAELLQQALNEHLEASLHYQNVLFKEVGGGRHIGTAIITRLPAARNRTRTHGRRQRILEGHIVVDGHDLAVFATHWTSRLTQGSELGRASYANAIYGAYRAMHKSNPAVDVLICGDFNDTPQDESVTRRLHATAEARAVSSTPTIRLSCSTCSPVRTHRPASAPIIIASGLFSIRLWSRPGSWTGPAGAAIRTRRRRSTRSPTPGTASISRGASAASAIAESAATAITFRLPSA
jgi:endonuclease/exonuclease/phosphatase family metal-dependent hydrolase